MKTVGIFTYCPQQLPPWDPNTIKSGIAGSEEAVIYLSQQLAELGLRVFVFGNPPKDSSHGDENANPRFLKWPDTRLPRLDIAISWRMTHIAKMLKNWATRVYLWPHDILAHPVPMEQIGALDDVLWLSQWQRRQWISVEPAFTKFTQIFGNGVNLEQFQPLKPRKNPFSCIYGSNYGRGLSYLADLWEEIKKVYPTATLDIYYGWQHWGVLSQNDEVLLRQKISRLPDVKEHGCVGHEELNRAFSEASFWTYPCIKPETFCITALRAQLSGAVPVVIKSAALFETVRYGYSCFKREDYFQILNQALGDAKRISLEDRAKMGTFIREEFTWKEIANKFQELFFS